MNKIGPNDPCPCGSGKKTKKCCGTAGNASHPVPSAPTLPPGTFLDPVDRMSNRIIDLLDAGLIDEAERAARGLLDDHPDEPDGLERMAEVLEAKGELRAAADHHRRVARFHRRPGHEYGEEAAARHLAEARRLDPDTTTDHEA